MKNQFSLKRFGMLFQKHTSENYKSYLLSAGVLTGIMFLIMSFATYTVLGRPMNPDQQMLMFVLFLFAAGTIFTSTIFASLGDKRKAIALLTLPATHLEKYLVSWFYSFVVFLIVYTGIFYLVNTSVLHLFKQAEEEIRLYNIFADQERFFEFFFAITFLHSLAFLGSVWFEKVQFIKTAFSFLLFILILQLLNYQILEWLLGQDLEFATLFGNVAFRQNNEMTFIKISEKQEYLRDLMLLVLGFILWASTYFRLKEKQV